MFLGVREDKNTETSSLRLRCEVYHLWRHRLEKDPLVIPLTLLRDTACTVKHMSGCKTRQFTEYRGARPLQLPLLHMSGVATTLLQTPTSVPTQTSVPTHPNSTLVLKEALFDCSTPHTTTVPGWPPRPVNRCNSPSPPLQSPAKVGECKMPAT